MGALKKAVIGSIILLSSFASTLVGYSIEIKSANPKKAVTLFGGFMRPSATVYIIPDLLDPDYQWKQINPKLIKVGDLNSDGIDDFLFQSDKFDYLGLEDLIYVSNGSNYSALRATKLSKREVASKVLEYCKSKGHKLNVPSCYTTR